MMGARAVHPSTCGERHFPQVHLMAIGISSQRKPGLVLHYGNAK